MSPKMKWALGLATGAVLSINSALFGGGLAIPGTIGPGQDTGLTGSATAKQLALIRKDLRKGFKSPAKPGQRDNSGSLIPTTWGDVFHLIPTEYKLVVVPADVRPPATGPQAPPAQPAK